MEKGLEEREGRGGVAVWILPRGCQDPGKDPGMDPGMDHGLDHGMDRSLGPMVLYAQACAPVSSIPTPSPIHGRTRGWSLAPSAPRRCPHSIFAISPPGPMGATRAEAHPDS